MDTSLKSDIYQTSNEQSRCNFNFDKHKNVVDKLTLNNKTKNNCAKSVDDDYILVIEDSIERLKTERYRLASSEIESILLSHTDVQDVAVIGLPHEQKGNEIHAFVVLKEYLLADKNIEHVLREMINSNIGRVAVPKFIEFIDYLAKTSSREVMRKALKAQALEQKLMLLN